MKQTSHIKRLGLAITWAVMLATVVVTWSRADNPTAAATALSDTGIAITAPALAD
ncbi:MAG: hypothetical protein KDE22_15910 [Rhodobacterales bacterium]|nr:hypothetical protein [Rhodobacterales bacterium]